MTFGTMEIWKRNILITGVVVFLIYMLHFLKTYQECRRLTQRIPGQKPKNDLDDASSRIARKYHVTIKYVPEKCGSFTQGIRRPTVVIAQSEDEKATQYQTRHEMTHIRYHHTFWSHLAFLVNAVHFWNPLAYLFYQEVRQCIELHCDEKVCQSLTREECIEYGKRILDAAVQDSNTGVLNFRGKIRYHNMEERIKMIKRKPKTKKGILLAALLLMSAATAIPVLAYESPKVAYDEELEAGEVLTDVVFVPDGEDGPDWCDMNWIPKEEIPFITTDAYFMDEVGNVTYLSEEDVSMQATCSHSFQNGIFNKHKENTTGGCTVAYYRCQKCTKCNYIKNQEKISENNYGKCPHK